jgi:hypothetical protein
MKVVVFLFYSALPGRDSCAGDSGSGLMMDVELPARPYDPRWIQASFVILKMTLQGGQHSLTKSSISEEDSFRRELYKDLHRVVQSH